MSINVNQLDPNPKVLNAVGSAPTTGAGTGVFYPKTVASNVEAFYKDSNNVEVQITSNGQVNASGSGANTALSNLASVAINTNLLPGADNSIDVGSASKRYANLHAVSHKVYGTSAGAVSITAPSSFSSYGIVLPGSQGGASTFLQNDGSGNLSWQTVSGSGANTSLSNLASVALNADLLPGTDSLLSLGSSSKRFTGANIFNLSLYGSSSGSISISTPSTVTAYNLIMPSAQGAASTFLQNDGAGNLSWQTASGGSGANQALSNLASVAINTSLLPGTDDSVNLGSSSARWANSHVVNNIIYGVTSGAITLKAADTTTSYSVKMPAAQGGASTVLQNDGSGNLSWAAAGGSGANTALSNLASVAINTDLLPGTDNTVNLGSSSKRFATAFITAINSNSSPLSITGNGNVNFNGSNLNQSGNVAPISDNASSVGTSSLRYVNIHALNHLIYGSTSGAITHEAANTTTSYAVKWPGAQGAASTVLQNDGSGNLSWASASSGANAALSNLSAVAINAGLTPGADNAIALGTSTRRYQSLNSFADIIYGSTSGGVTLQAPSTVTSYALTFPNAQGGASTYLQNDGSGNLSWQTSPSAGANAALSNLASVAINTSLLPGTDDSIDAGSSSKRFANIHALNNLLYGSTSGAITLKAADTTTSYAVKMPAAQGAASTYLQNDGSGNLSWATVSGSGANTALSNLASVAINTSLLPGTDNSIDVGSASFRYANIHALNHKIYGSTSGAITLEAANTTTSYSVKMPAAQGASSTFLQNDGSGNLSWVAGGGGGTTTTYARFTTTNANDVTIIGTGSIGSLTVGKSGNLVTISGLTGGMIIQSIWAYFSGTDVGSNTSVAIKYPDANGATTLANAVLPVVQRYTSTFSFAGTNAGTVVADGSGNVTITHTGSIIANNQAMLRLNF